MSDERSIDATPQRRESARREGRFPRSRELAIGIVLLAAAAAFHFGGQNWVQLKSDTLREYLSTPVSLTADPDHWITDGRRLLLSICWQLAPILAGTLALIALAHLIQGGFVWLPQRVSPDVSRLIDGKNESTVGGRVTKSLFGLVAFCTGIVVLWTGLWYVRGPLFSSGYGDLPLAAAKSGDILARVLVSVLATSLIFSGFEYAYRLWSYDGSLKISPAEQREEAKGRNTMSVAPAGTGSERRVPRDARSS